MPPFVQTLPVTQWRDVIHMEPGVQLAASAWLPDQPKAIVLISHGHNEHPGRYSHVINLLVADGYAVYVIDHRGHGRSTGTRGLIEDFDRTADDLHVLTLFAQGRHRGLPTVLIGHSMGGLIALRYALRHGSHLSALVTSGPALVIDRDTSPITVAAGRAVGAVLPKAPLKRKSSSRCGLSTEAWVCDQFGIDHRTRSGDPLFGTVAAMLRAGEDTRARLGEITVPLLAMHGADDNVTFPIGTEMIRDHAGSEDKTVILWEGMRHEIFNEADRAKVIETLRSWLAARVG